MKHRVHFILHKILENGSIAMQLSYYKL